MEVRESCEGHTSREGVSQGSQSSGVYLERQAVIGVKKFLVRKYQQDYEVMENREVLELLRLIGVLECALTK